jgi:hypothetical protein
MRSPSTLLLPFFLALASLAGCGDPATFRPAKGVHDMPEVKTAYRVKVKPEGCVSLGFIDAEGQGAIENIAETAARHGANNYLIALDTAEEVEIERGITGAVARPNHKYVAEALRCPTSDDPPK